MPLDQILLFISVTFIVSASPGPLMLACMNYGARYGLKRTFQAMLGACLGNIVLVALSGFGLGLLVQNSSLLFNSIKWLGALYLIILGIQQIRQPIVVVDSPNAPIGKSLFLSYFFISISNPKGLIYFGALFPQFIDYQQPLLWQYALLTCIFLVSDLGWMTAYAAMGNKIMSWLKSPQHQRRFNAFSGATLVLVGIMLATATRPQ